MSHLAIWGRTFFGIIILTAKGTTQRAIWGRTFFGIIILTAKGTTQGDGSIVSLED